MVINVEEKNDGYLVSIEGELNTNSADDLSKTFENLLFDAQNLIIDMEKLDYITSAGIRVLLKASLDIRNRGELKIINVNDAVQKILKMVQLDSFIDVATKEDEHNPSYEEVVFENKYYFEPHSLSTKEKKLFSEAAQECLKYACSKVFDVVNEDDDVEAFAIVMSYENEGKAVVEEMVIISEDKRTVLKEMIAGIKSYYFDKGYTKVIFLYWDDENLSCMNQLADNLNLKNLGEAAVHMEYSMEQLKASGINKQREQLEKMMTNVKTIPALSEVELFDLKLIPNVNMEVLDPVFCRLFVMNESILGGLNGKEISDDVVLVNHLHVQEKPGTERAIVLMLASFIFAVIDIMGESTRLIFDLLNDNKIKGIETVLGKPQKLSKKYGFEASKEVTIDCI